MRDLGSLWKNCQDGTIPKGEWEYQRYLIVDNIQYFDYDIKDITFDRGLLYSDFGIGNCIASKLDAVIIPKGDFEIIKGSKAELFIRISTVSDGDTDWVPFGTYFVYNPTREADKVKIECYDGIRYLEARYLDGTEQVVWPIPCTQAITKILEYLDVSLDSRTTLNSAFFVDDPGRMSMREVLMYIGSMHGGNWYLTEENKLRLVIPSNSEPLGTIDKSKTKRIISSKSLQFDKVIAKYGKENEDILTSGEGYNDFTFYNPWATQDIADNVLSILLTYKYNTFELQSAEIDLALELGDSIIINGVSANLWQVTYGLRLYASITIPSDIESTDTPDVGSYGQVDPPTGQYVPKLFWDFNKKPIKIGSIETQIGSIDVDVTMAGNAQGHFQITFMSNSETEAIIRIYDTEVQQLYSPITKKIHKGYNQIGIPHSYIRLKQGIHSFYVTMQTRLGTVNIDTRAIMYSIDLFGIDLKPITFDIRDISIRQPEFALEPTDIYIIAMSDEDYPIVLRTRFMKGRRLQGSDFVVVWEFPALAGAKELAIEFDGLFELFLGHEKQTLVTDEKPYIFWTDSSDKLWCQYGDEVPTRQEIAQDVLQVSVCRGWNSKVFIDQDFGLVAAYIKYDGFVFYRTKIGKADPPYVWETEEELEEAGQDNSYVHVHTLNDYRMGLAVTGCNKHFITDRVLIGAGAQPQSVALRHLDGFILGLWHMNDLSGNEPFGVESHTRLSQTEFIVYFNYPIYVADENLPYGFELKKRNNTILNIVSYEWLNNKTLKFVTEGYSLYSNILFNFLPLSRYMYYILDSMSFVKWFVPTKTFVLEGESFPGQYAGQVNVLGTYVDYSISYDPLVWNYNESDESADIKVSLSELDVTYNKLVYIDYLYDEQVACKCSLYDLEITHQYVGSEPL